jgi:hypothetical protein
MTLAIVLGGEAKFILKAVHFDFRILATDIVLDQHLILQIGLKK